VEPRRIFIVDDEQITAWLLSSSLELDGYQARVLPGKLAEVLDELKSGRPDIVVVDFHLAWGEGTELVKAMRQTPELRQTAILMYSGLDWSEKCQQAGADGFLLKPFSWEEFNKALHNAWQHRQD
jgi:CheY-like chemotaxis protein